MRSYFSSLRRSREEVHAFSLCENDTICVLSAYTVGGQQSLVMRVFVNRCLRAITLSICFSMHHVHRRPLAHLLACHVRNKTFCPSFSLAVFYVLYEISSERASERVSGVVYRRPGTTRGRERERGKKRVLWDEKSNMNSRHRKEDAAIKGNVKASRYNANLRAISFANLRNEDHRERGNKEGRVLGHAISSFFSLFSPQAKDGLKVNSLLLLSSLSRYGRFGNAPRVSIYSQ